ncbi:MAG TPA: PQQ-binding-like beta-propeller repeat protein [Pirellulaceae bacterium]|nr:PQQ-binding-like beta-propeller repeat protein [Pirellulaceae bacterium]
MLVILLIAHLRGEDHWHQFRGPSGNGHAPTGAKVATNWSETEHVKWKAPIEGKAHSSPVVWNEQVWVTTAPLDGKQAYAICLDLDSGKVIHKLLVFEIPMPQPLGVDKNSYASPTPVIEQGRIYVHFGAHGTACLDTASGKTLWSRQDLPCNHHRGPASSPILWSDLLILTFDGFDLQYVVALDKNDGKTVWKTDRNIEYGTDNGDVMKAYSTPHVFDVGGREQLISPSAGACLAYDPATGKELWRVRSGGMNASGRPVMGHGLVFMGTADGGYKFFAASPDGRGDVTESHVAWKATKGAPRYASPILVGDLLFTATDKDVLCCLDPKTGEELWQKRVGGTFTASPIYAGGQLYFASEEGSTFVVKPAAEFELVATNKLPDGCLASPAVAGNALILRTKSAVYRIEE